MLTCFSSRIIPTFNQRIVVKEGLLHIIKSCKTENGLLLLQSKIETSFFNELTLMHVWNQEIFQTFQFKWDVSYLKQFKSVCSKSPCLKPSLKPSCILHVQSIVFFAEVLIIIAITQRCPNMFGYKLLLKLKLLNFLHEFSTTKL